MAETSNNINSVAHILYTYLFFTGSWIFNQITHLDKWNPFVLCKKTENLEIFPVEKLYSLQDKPFLFRYFNEAARFLFGYYPYYRRIVKQEKPNVFHAHFGPAGYIAQGLSEKCRIPLITTFYGYDLSQLPLQRPVWRSRYKGLFRKGALFLVEGSYMRQQLIGLGCPTNKIRVQHLGVDLHNFNFLPRKVNEDGKVHILVAGTFTEKKGIPYALEAFARLSHSYKNIHLTLIGDARNNQAELFIKRQILDIIEQNGLFDQVTLMGYQPHKVLIEQYYKNHILLSPSVQAKDGDNEGGSPVTITEASATGMPVVSTMHCDIPEVIINERTGYLAPERDISALVDRLERLINDPSLWAQIGLAGRKHIEDEYDVRKQAIRLEKVYDQLL